MDLNFTPDEERFRDEVRDFFATSLPKKYTTNERLGLSLTKAEQEDWQAILSAKGWLAPHWPAEWGGTGWTVVERFIFDLEGNLAHAPCRWCGPARRSCWRAGRVWSRSSGR